MAEPGRHISSNSCFLATRVIGKREKNGKKTILKMLKY
jgi:diaminopimelate decarboxylase